MSSNPLQDSVNKMMNSLEKSHIKGIAKQGFVCSASCFDTIDSMEAIQQCVSNCQSKPANAQNVIQSEMQNLQNRVSRCTSECQDVAQDSLARDGEKALPAIQKQMEKCVSACESKHVALIKDMKKRIEKTLDAYIK